MPTETDAQILGGEDGFLAKTDISYDVATSAILSLSWEVSDRCAYATMLLSQSGLTSVPITGFAGQAGLVTGNALAGYKWNPDQAGGEFATFAITVEEAAPAPGA